MIQVLHELERTLALLAFDDPVNSPFGDLLLPTHRQKVRIPLGTVEVLCLDATYLHIYIYICPMLALTDGQHTHALLFSCEM